VAGEMKLGQGGRFKRLTRQLRGRKGKKKVHDPGALAGWIGRRKYGAKRMAKWSAAGRKSVAVLDCLSDCDAILKAASDFTGPMRSCNVCGHTFRKELQECPKCGHTMPLHWTQKPSTVSKGAAGTFARRLGRAAYTVATLGQSPEETNYERKVEGKKPRKLESASRPKVGVFAPTTLPGHRRALGRPRRTSLAQLPAAKKRKSLLRSTMATWKAKCRCRRSGKPSLLSTPVIAS